MTVLVTIAAILTASAPAEAAPVADVAARPGCSPCRYGADARRRARRELAQARWYLRRHRATRPYRAWLASTRACETRGQPAPYRTSTGNGYFGAYQFDLATWALVGGRGYPHLAPPLEQDYRAVRLLHLQGAGAWPACG